MTVAHERLMLFSTLLGTRRQLVWGAVTRARERKLKSTCDMQQRHADAAHISEGEDSRAHKLFIMYLICDVRARRRRDACACGAVLGGCVFGLLALALNGGGGFAASRPRRLSLQSLRPRPRSPKRKAKSPY
eukprot:scaffold6508_cov103-Isochrysis_galbana.AAC.1